MLHMQIFDFPRCWWGQLVRVRARARARARARVRVRVIVIYSLVWAKTSSRTGELISLKAPAQLPLLVYSTPLYTTLYHQLFFFSGRQKQKTKAARQSCLHFSRVLPYRHTVQYIPDPTQNTFVLDGEYRRVEYMCMCVCVCVCVYIEQQEEVEQVYKAEVTYRRRTLDMVTVAAAASLSACSQLAAANVAILSTSVEQVYSHHMYIHMGGCMYSINPVTDESE